MGGQHHQNIQLQQLNLFSEIDREKITLDLFQAYFDARKNKRNTINALAFEKHLEANLFALASEIIERKYTPKPSIYFIVDKPVKREIFAGIFIFRTTFIPGIFDHISTSWLTFTSYLLPQTDINALIALTLIIVGIPIVAIIYGGMKLVFRFKANDKIFGAFIFVFWLISAGVLTSMVLIEGRGFAHYGVEREEFTLFSTAPDTLYLRVNSEKMLEIRETSDYVEIRNFGIYFNPDMNVFYGKPELNFYESDRNEINMTLLREARGNSSREARKSAEGILYSWEINGTTLTLDPCFSALEDTPWKAQHAEITISLPAEVIIAIDDELAELLDNRYFSHFWSYHDKVINTGNYWYVKGSSIKPLNQ